jgi:hypothetical protein
VFEDLDYKEKKHMTYIKYRNRGSGSSDRSSSGSSSDSNIMFHCFNTVSIYNYIIQCINNNTIPLIPTTKEELTVDEIEQICDKISKLTRNKKHILEAKLIKLKYKMIKLKNKYGFIIINIDKILKLQKNREDLFKKPGEVVGILKIQLYIIFDEKEQLQLPLFNTNYEAKRTGINFPDLYNTRNSEVIQVPYFYGISRSDAPKVKSTDLLMKSLDSLFKTKANNLLYSEFFPYRKINNPGEPWNSILTFPKFDFDLEKDSPTILYKKVNNYILKVYDELSR